MLVVQRRQLGYTAEVSQTSGLTKSFQVVLFAINSHCLNFTLAKRQIMA